MSRKALAGTVTINTTSVVAAVPRNIIGSLHPPQHTGMDANVVGAAVKIARTDKLINASPIKAGGTDATHPSLGHSGTHSWDWQVVDRTVNEYARLGMKLYISVDSTPQILGGIPPFSGTQLATDMSVQAGYSNAVPTDITAWTHLVTDLVYHITVDLATKVELWSFWNEPEASYAWLGTRAQWITFYVATANAIRAADPFDTPIGGPELAGLDASNSVWVNDLMAACAGGAAPLDFISAHEYSGDVGNFDSWCKIVSDLAVTHGFSANMPIVLGEFEWSNRQMFVKGPPIGPGFFQSRFEHVKAFAAAYTAAYLAHALATGRLRGFAFSHLTYDSVRDGSYAVDQLLSLDGRKWATYNVLEGVQKCMGDEQLTTTTDLPPGIYVSPAMHDTATGRIGFWVASFGWANRSARTVNITLSGMTGNKRLRRWFIDPDHSSAWDDASDPNSDPAASGLPASKDLELIEDMSASAASFSTLSLAVPKWSTTFITFDPN